MAGGWSGDVFEHLVALFYRGTTDPSSWNEAMKIVAEGLHATAAAIHVHGQSISPATTIGAWGIPRKGSLKDYERYYADHNIWLMKGAHLLTPGAILTGDDMCTDEVFLRSEYYNDFLRPNNIRYSIRVCLTNDPEPLSYLSAGRPHEAHNFGDAQRRKLGALVPHLTQAIRIQERLETLQSRRSAASGALERLPLGVFFLDGRGRVLEMNSAATKLAEKGDGLKIERGTLAAVDARAEVQLQRLIFGASASDPEHVPQQGGTFHLPRGDGRHPLSVMVAPTGATGLFPASRLASVVVLVEEPTRRATAPFDAFTNSYGLSPAEAALTAKLVGGMTVHQAAVSAGIRPSTARSHLKRVFAKTGAKRQSDLVRRVLTYDAGRGGQA